MGVQTYNAPDYSTQSGTVYPTSIDKALAVHHRIAGPFAPHEQSAGSPAPDMTVVIDAGYVVFGGQIYEKAQQTVSGFTAPAAGTRIDRIVRNPISGDAIRIAGTAAAGSPSAVPPSIPAGMLPMCQVAITSTDTAITNDMITDERGPLHTPVSGLLHLDNGVFSNDASKEWILTPYSAYSKLRLVLENMLPQTDNVSAFIRFSTDGGATFDAGASDYVVTRFFRDSTNADSSIGAASSAITIAGNIGNLSNEGFTSDITFLNLTSTTRHSMMHYHTYQMSNLGVGAGITGVSARAAAQNTDAIRLILSGGNIASGEWTLYAMT